MIRPRNPTPASLLNNGFSVESTVSGQGSATPTRSIESARAGVNPAPYVEAGPLGL